MSNVGASLENPLSRVAATSSILVKPSIRPDIPSPMKAIRLIVSLNETNKTRMSLNCRFKSLFSPEYSKTPHERVTGTFYKPFTFSPVTELGLNYNDEIDF